MLLTWYGTKQQNHNQGDKDRHKCTTIIQAHTIVKA